MTDALPRLELIKQSYPSGLEGIDKLVVNKGVPAITESLQMIGISEDQLIFTDSSTHIQAQNLVIPSLPDRAVENTPLWVCQFLRKQLMPHRADIDPITSSKTIDAT